jgi:hypothetical protein
MMNDINDIPYSHYLTYYGEGNDAEFLASLAIVATAAQERKVILTPSRYSLGGVDLMSPALSRLGFISLLEKNGNNAKNKESLFQVCQLFMMICRDGMVNCDKVKTILDMSRRGTTRKKVFNAVFVALTIGPPRRAAARDADEAEDTANGHQKPQQWTICKPSPIIRTWCLDIEKLWWDIVFCPKRVYSTYNSHIERRKVRRSVLKTSETVVAETLIADLMRTLEIAKKPVDERIHVNESTYWVKGKEFSPFVGIFFSQFRYDREGHDRYIRKELLNADVNTEGPTANMIVTMLESPGTPGEELMKILDCMIFVCTFSGVEVEPCSGVEVDPFIEAPNIVKFMMELSISTGDVKIRKMRLLRHLLNRLTDIIKLRVRIGREWPNIDPLHVYRTTAACLTSIVSTLIHWVNGPMSFDMAMLVVQFDIDDSQLNEALVEVKHYHKTRTAKRNTTSKRKTTVGRGTNGSAADTSVNWRRKS